MGLAAVPAVAGLATIRPAVASAIVGAETAEEVTANATAAEQDQALATEAATRTVRLGLVADLASAWATYAADRDLLAIAQDTAVNARRAVELTQLRLQGGIAPRTDVRQAEQVLATAEGDVAALTAALAQDQNLIELLLGGPVAEPLAWTAGWSALLLVVFVPLAMRAYRRRV